MLQEENVHYLHCTLSQLQEIKEQEQTTCSKAAILKNIF